MTIEAVLLDRDGVINLERSDYVKSWQEFELLPGSLEALARLAVLDCPILVISNQSAIGRGLMTWDTVVHIHVSLQRAAAEEGGRIDGFYVCPHHPHDGCDCRKPQPGMLLQAARDFDLALENCIFVGDAVTDYQAAMATGCRSILVRTGRQGQSLDGALGKVSGVQIVQNLAEAVAVILAENPAGDALQDEKTV